MEAGKACRLKDERFTLTRICIVLAKYIVRKQMWEGQAQQTLALCLPDSAKSRTQWKSLTQKTIQGLVGKLKVPFNYFRLLSHYIEAGRGPRKK